MIIKTDRVNLKFLLAVLNSNVIQYWLLHKGKLQGNQYQVDKTPLLGLPIRVGSNSQQLEIAGLVEKVYELDKKAKHQPKSREASKRKYELEINQLIYNLYELTSQEVKVMNEFRGHET